MIEDKTYFKYQDNISYRDKIMRYFWFIIYMFLYRPFAMPIFNFWRITLLKVFGAEIGAGSIVHASAYIPAPWNLVLGKLSCIGPQVKLHFGKTVIGSKVTISQRAYLCSASHEISSLNTPFISGIIVIEDYVWVAAEAFIMMNVSIGEGAVVGARSAVFKDINPWTVVGGNPAKFIKNRTINE